MCGTEKCGQGELLGHCRTKLTGQSTLRPACTAGLASDISRPGVGWSLVEKSAASEDGQDRTLVKMRDLRRGQTKKWSDLGGSPGGTRQSQVCETYATRGRMVA